jgi:formamidopyrimidine-DNA glycosylase
MPELPEVQTTVNGLKEHIIGLHITDVWSDYDSAYFKGSETIKDLSYFKRFKKEIVGMNVVAVERRAKNILIHTQGRPAYAGLPCAKTLLIHLKMTGHLLYGRYHFNTKNKKDPWEATEPESLKDPKNRHVHFLI